MKINQVLVESAGATVAFAYGRFNPSHVGHIEVWRTVEQAGKNWFIGTNPSTLGPNDPLTFQQKSAWMEEIYPPIAGHIVPEQSVLTLAAYIFKKLRKNERATVAYITDAQDWAWSGKLLNQYNGVEGKHGYYKFAEIVHVPSPRVSSATALRDAARADDKVAFYHASGTDPKLKVAGLTYFDTVKQAVEKYPVPVKRGQKVAEAYDHNAPFNAADFQRHMDRLRAREELRKTDPMKALVGDMIDKDREKEALAKRKKPEDDSMSTSDPRHPQYSYTQAGQQGVAEGSLNEFSVDGFGDSGDKRSKLLASVGRLFDAGNKVDWQVPGQMGHVTRVQDDGVTMKKWKTPHSRMSFFLPMRDDSRDSKYTIKMVGPKHYAVVGAEQGVAEGAPIVVAQAPIDVRNPKKDQPKQRYMGDIVPPTQPPSTEKRGVKGRPGQRPMPTYDVAEVSTELRNRYVTRASDDYGFANFAARASKDHPGLDDYSREQEQRAKKRAAGLNRALSDKRTGREQNVAEEQKTVAKTWDQMTSQERLSGVKGRTVWNEKTQRYYTVFDVPVKQSTDETSLATMRDYFAKRGDGKDPLNITTQRLHYSKDNDSRQATHKKEFKSKYEYEQWLKQNKLQQISGVREDDEAGEVKQQKQLIPFPAGTTKVAVSDVYDWYKLGQVISDLDDADPTDFGQGAPETVIAFGSEEEEHKLLPLLQRLGLKLKDIDQPVSEAYHAGNLYEQLNKERTSSWSLINKKRQ